MNNPNKVQDIIDDFFKNISNENLEKLKKIEDVTLLHHSVGRYIRNTYSFWTPESGQLRADIWERTPDARKLIYDNHWKEWGGGETYRGANMHPDDASHELLSMIAKETKNYERT